MSVRQAIPPHRIAKRTQPNPTVLFETTRPPANATSPAIFSTGQWPVSTHQTASTSQDLTHPVGPTSHPSSGQHSPCRRSCPTHPNSFHPNRARRPEPSPIDPRRAPNRLASRSLHLAASLQYDGPTQHGPRDRPDPNSAASPCPRRQIVPQPLGTDPFRRPESLSIQTWPHPAQTDVPRPDPTRQTGPLQIDVP